MMKFFIGFSLILASCTDSNFTRDNENKNKKSEKEESAPVADQSPSENPKEYNNPRQPGDNPPSEPNSPPIGEKKSTPIPKQPSDSFAVRFPMIGIINMDSMYQVTNEGYRVSVEQNGKVLAQAPLSLQSIMDGESVDMQGSAYGKPFLTNSAASYVSPEVSSGALASTQAKISICMPEDQKSAFDTPIRCKDLNKFVGHSNGSNTLIGATAEVSVKNKALVVSAIRGTQSIGQCGTSQVPCFSVMHPVFGFASASNEFNNDNASPLVLDLNHNRKLDLVSAFLKDDKEPVSFDILGTGEKTRTGWVAKEDALLALDLNRNDKIDNASELFGEHSDGRRFTNGYLALAQHDKNRDGKIDRKDKIYEKLIVWQDENQDGISQKSEMTRLDTNGIAILHLRYHAFGSKEQPVIEAGNEIRLMGSFETAQGKIYPMADVWFEVRKSRSLGEIVSH